MVIAALVVLLFLLGFGFMIYSHAHREIHVLNRKIGAFISVFIIFFTTVMILYLGGYLFVNGVIRGEDPFQVGMERFVSNDKDRNLEKSLLDLNSTLQRQAMDQSNATRDDIQAELKATQVEILSLKKSIAADKKLAVKTVRSTYAPRKRAVYTARRSSSKSSQQGEIRDLTNYDSSNYSSDNEPMLYIPVEKD